MKIKSHSKRLVAANSLAIIIALAGCGRISPKDPEALIASYDFQAALPLLEQRCRAHPDDDHSRRQLALALLIEGRTDEGWKSLIPDTAGARDHIGQTLLDAARTIIREEERVGEAVGLLDSAIVFDAKLQKDAMQLGWQRAVEYLGYGSDAGYHLMAFAARLDPLTLGRLRAGYPELGKRYDEFDAADRKLRMITRHIARYRDAKGAYPADLSALASFAPAEDLHIDGWLISFAPSGRDKIVVSATSLPRGVGDLPAGSRIAESIEIHQ